MELLARLESELRNGRTLEAWEAEVEGKQAYWENTSEEWTESGDLEWAGLILEEVVIEILREGFDFYCEEDLVNYAESAGRL